jgi:ATP-dependent Clp protease ATP-binding subunit ClpA
MDRTVRKEVLDELARRVLAGDLRDGETVVVDSDGIRFTFHANPSQAPPVA